MISEEKKLDLIKEKEIAVSNTIDSPKTLGESIAKEISIYDREMLFLINFDDNLKAINCSIVSIGSINASIATVREVYKASLLSNASAIMLIHNHPSGDNKPSRSDLLITEEIAKVGKTLGIEVLDHYIAGEDGFYSMKDKKDIVYSEINYASETYGIAQVNVIAEKNAKKLSYDMMGTPKDAVNSLFEIIPKSNSGKALIALDTRLRPINMLYAESGKEYELTEKKVTEFAIKSNSASVMLFEYSSSGSMIITNDTLKFATKMVNTIESAGIEVIDYIQFNEYKDLISMKESDILPEFKSVYTGNIDFSNKINESAKSYKAKPKQSAKEKILENQRKIADMIIANLGKGYLLPPMWNKGMFNPTNPVTGVTYRGRNAFRLMVTASYNQYDDPRWCTYIQAESKGWHVNKGAQGVLCEKWIYTREEVEKDENGKIVYDENGNKKTKIVPLEVPVANFFYVFNANDITGIEPLPKTEDKTLTDTFLKNYGEELLASTKCPILESAQPTACYIPSTDTILMPSKSAFESSKGFLSVVMHEMAHSTGHPDRLNRDLSGKFGTELYAKEELNAEISSMFLQSRLGVVVEPDSNDLRRHTNYINSWITLLKNDPNQLFDACSRASKITDYLYDNFEKYQEYEKKLVNTLKANNLSLSDECLSNIRALNKITGKENSIKDISDSYLSKKGLMPEKQIKLIEAIGKELENQEKAMQSNKSNKYVEFMKEELTATADIDN